MTDTSLVNRELSWLEFNRRVLEEAQDPSVPLLERVKFLSIFSSNLDEFFMVRVAGLKRAIRAGETAPGPDGATPAEALQSIARRIHELAIEQHRCFLEEIQPLLAAEGVAIVRPKEATPKQRAFLEVNGRMTVLSELAFAGATDPQQGLEELAALASAIRGANPGQDR